MELGSLMTYKELCLGLVVFMFIVPCLECAVLLKPNRSCEADQFTNGCSVPLGVEAPFKRSFTPSCNKHDICYGCGHHYNWTRDLCDDAFLADMKSTCHKRGDHVHGKHVRHRRFLSALLEVWYFFQGLSKEERRCTLVADMYYKVVRTFGKPHFEVRDHKYCRYTCADKHGSPYEDLPQKRKDVRTN